MCVISVLTCKDSGNPAPVLRCRAQVFSEVVAPFNLLPRSVLEGTCNTVITAVFNSLLPAFLQRLAADYEKWSTDPEYRARRSEGEPIVDEAAVGALFGK